MGNLRVLRDGTALSETGLSIASPADKAALVPAVIDRRQMQHLAGLAMTTRIYESQYLICGMPPYVNNIGYHEKEDVPETESWGGIKDAKYLFRGLERPRDCENGDKVVYVYISHPKYVYEHIPSMVCCAKRELAPDNSVLAVYVVFNEDLSSATIMSWEWVTSADNDKPDDYQNRYIEQVW